MTTEEETIDSNELTDEQANVPEEPDLGELSQIQITVNEDQSRFNDLMNEFGQKYGNLLPKLEEIADAYDEGNLEMNDEKATFVKQTMAQVKQMEQLSQ